MAIALRNPITAKVDDRASFLRTLLEEYPKYLNEWEHSTEEEFARARVFTSIYNDELA